MPVGANPAGHRSSRAILGRSEADLGRVGGVLGERYRPACYTGLMPKRLVEIKVLVEVDSNDEVECLSAAFEATICPHPGGSDHRCPMRWFIVSSELGEEEAAEWEELLNE